MKVYAPEPAVKRRLFTKRLASTVMVEKFETALKVTTSVLLAFAERVTPGTAPPTQLVAVVQLPSVATAFHVWLAACAEPDKAKRPAAESAAALAMPKLRRAVEKRDDGNSAPIEPEQMAAPRVMRASGRGDAGAVEFMRAAWGVILRRFWKRNR